MEHQLIYISTASQLMAETELHQMLEEARNQNLKHDITGMLIYVEGLFLDANSVQFNSKRTGRFMQVLEGSKCAVDSIFDKISSDGRHRNILLIRSEPQADRNFESWQMGFHSITLEEFKNSPGYFDIDDLAVQDLAEAPVNTALQFIRGFYKRGMSKTTLFTPVA